MKTLDFRSAAILLLISISLIMLTLVSAFTLRILKKTILAQFERDSTLMLDHGRSLIENELVQAENLLLFFSESGGGEDLERLSSFVESNLLEGAFLAMGYSDGSYYFSDGRVMPEDYDPRRQSWFLNQYLEEDHLYWSGLFLDYLNQEIVISASVRMHTQDGRDATVSILFPIEAFGGYIARLNRDYRGFLMLSDGGGTVLVNQQNRLIGYRLPGVSPGFGLMAVSLEGEPFFLNTAGLDSIGMYIISAVPESLLKSRIRYHIGRVFLYEFCFLLLYALLMYFLTNMLIRPIHHFVDMMRLVESGEYTVREQKRPLREIEMLYQPFNRMVEKIEDRNAVLKSREIKIKDLAYYDTLTKLPNRLLLKKSLNRILEGGGNPAGALMYIDLDRFKIINDTMGHSMGDKVLVEISRKLLANLRAGQTAARLGGDEFVLVLPDVASVELVMKIADRVLAQLNAPVVIGSNSFVTGASIGIVMFPTHGTDADVLLKKADMAMYKAKQDGKNNWKIFEEHLEYDNINKLQIKNGIRDGLKKGLFEVYFQPQVNAATREMCGLEALLRVGNSTLENVSVGKVISIAEETGHIIELETYVLKEVVRFSEEYYRLRGRTIPVSVNISPIHIMHKDFVEKILSLMAELRVPGNPIELEITEFTMLNSHQDTLDKLMLLREKGIKLHLDDFGTGYSSLNYLQELPINYVKIDRSFIQKIEESHKAASIISLIIRLSHNLGFSVIAEGVENQVQYETLKGMECDIIQGFLFSRPVPGDVLLFNKEFILSFV